MFWQSDQRVPLPRESSADSVFDVERDRRIRLLEAGTFAMVLISAALALHMWILEVERLFAAQMIAVAAAVLNLVRMRRGAPIVLSGNITIGISFAMIVISIVSIGGFYHPTFAWLYVVPIGAVLLVDNRSSYYWTAAVALTTIGFWALDGAGAVFPNLVPEESRHVQALATRMGLLFGLIALATSFAMTQRRTERLLAEGNTAMRLEAQCVSLLQLAAVAANENDDFDLAIDTCVGRVLQTTGWRLGLIWEPLSAGSDEWVCKERVRSAPDVDAVELVRLSHEYRVQVGVKALGSVVETGQPAWAGREELEKDGASRARAALDAGFNSAVAIPIAIRGSVIRIVEFFGADSSAPDERLVDVLCDVGRQLGRVAERVRLQESVRQSQKLESIGQLAAGLAHEINNPMAYVRANLGMLRQEWEEIYDQTKREHDVEALREQIKACDELIVESLDGVDRTVAIVRDMREFTRDGGGVLETVAVSEFVESSLRVAASARPSGVSVLTEIEPGLQLRCLPTRMRQVFLNLIVNAFHAVRENGYVRIQSVSSNDHVLIEVEDDGHGIENCDRERIFEPFYTTKPAGHGTGLGLYITFEIVRWHGGTIEVHSTPGEGSLFKLDLPSSFDVDERSKSAHDE